MQRSNWRKKVKWLVIFVVIALMVIAAPAFAQEEEFTWEGRWKLYQDVGSAFDITIEIIRNADGTYRLDWGDVVPMVDSDWHPPTDKKATLTVTDDYMKYVLARSYQGTPLQTLEWYFFRAEQNDQLRGTHQYWTENNFSGNESAWYIVENHIDSGVVGLCAARPGVSRPEQCKGSMPETVQLEEEAADENEENAKVSVSLVCHPEEQDDETTAINCGAQIITPDGSENWIIKWYLNGVKLMTVPVADHNAFLKIPEVSTGSHEVGAKVINTDPDVTLSGSTSITVKVWGANEVPVSLFCQPVKQDDGKVDISCAAEAYPPEGSEGWKINFNFDGELVLTDDISSGSIPCVIADVEPGMHSISVSLLRTDYAAAWGSASVKVLVEEEGDTAAEYADAGIDGSNAPEGEDAGGSDGAESPDMDTGSYFAPNEISPGAQTAAAVGTTSALAFWFIWELMSMAGSNSGSFVNNFISLLSNSGSGTKSSGGNFPKPPLVQPAVTLPVPGPVKSPAYLGSGEKEPEIFGGEDVHTILQALDLIPNDVKPGDAINVTQVQIDNMLSGHADGHPHLVTLADGSMVIVDNIKGIAFDGARGEGHLDFGQGISIVADIVKPETGTPQSATPVPVSSVSTPSTPSAPSVQPSQPPPAQPADQAAVQQPAQPPADQSQVDQPETNQPEADQPQPAQPQPSQPPSDQPLEENVDLLDESAGEESFEYTEDEPPEAGMIDGTTDSATDDF